jgi:hypothetical protein
MKDILEEINLASSTPHPSSTETAADSGDGFMNSFLRSVSGTKAD